MVREQKKKTNKEGRAVERKKEKKKKFEIEMKSKKEERENIFVKWISERIVNFIFDDYCSFCYFFWLK